MAANKTKPLMTGTLVLLSAYVVLQIATWVNRLLDSEHPGATIEADRTIPKGGLDATGDRHLGERDSRLAELLGTVEDAARRAAGPPPAGGPKGQAASSLPGAPAPITEADAPQFTFGRAEIISDGRYSHIAEVDFANLTYRARGIAPDLSIPLRNGTYDARDGVGFERAELLDTKLCDKAKAAPLAVVRLQYASGAGSSTCDEIVQVFELRDGRLAARHEIVYACAPGGTYAVDCNTGAVTVTATAWLGSEPHCCPSARDTAIFSFIGNHLQLLSWRREAWVSRTEPEKS